MIYLLCLLGGKGVLYHVRFGEGSDRTTKLDELYNNLIDQPTNSDKCKVLTNSNIQDSKYFFI
jgi:hypothetical protein